MKLENSNSIKKELTSERIINKIRLQKSANSNEKFIIVEGEQDKKLLKSFFHEDVNIEESYSGKMGVYKIIRRYQNEKDIIGIIDRDYEIQEEYKKIFFYDFNSMEIMIINCDEIFENLCNEYCNENFKDLREKIFNNLKYLSIIRKSNVEKSWELNLKRLSIQNCYNEGKLNKIKIITEIEKRKENQNRIDTEYIERKYEEKWTNEDYLLFTRGHDFLELFKIISNENNIKSKINIWDIESSLRVSYRMEDFMKTSLFRKIKKYENEQNIKFLKEG